jgi:hypothetical protein
LSEITNYTRNRILNCFQTLKEKAEGRYDIEMSAETLINTELQPRQVTSEIKKNFKMRRGENIREFDNFKIINIHPMYEFAKIATEIVNQEAEFCNFDYQGYMILYPEFEITKDTKHNDYTIYTIKERSTNQEFIFAIRNCVMAPAK